MQHQSLQGKVCVVTGAGGTGIGYEASFALARRGCETVLGCRGKKCTQAAARIRKSCPDCKVHALPLDISNVSSVSNFARSLSRLCRSGIHVLINNAAIARWGFEKREVLYGIDKVLLTNSIGPYLVAQGLREQLRKGARKTGTSSVVLTVASSAHRYGRAVRDPNGTATSHPKLICKWFPAVD